MTKDEWLLMRDGVAGRGRRCRSGSFCALSVTALAVVASKNGRSKKPAMPAVVCSLKRSARSLSIGNHLLAPASIEAERYLVRSLRKAMRDHDGYTTVECGILLNLSIILLEKVLIGF